MMRRIAVCLVSLVLTTPVWAEDKEPTKSPPASGGSGMQMDMSKMGPWTRKPTNESKTRKEIEAFIKEEDALMKKRDIEASLARVDYPIFMATDDSKGVPKAQSFDRQQYADMMRPMVEQTPADLQVNHKLDIKVLSDSLVTVNDDYTLTVGGQKYSGRNTALLVKRDGQWKWKAMSEPGWGDMPSTGVGGSGMSEDPYKKQKQ
ncbi:hypothetical protein ATI61_104139 [Archangium gephyra]|uniref:DUF4440 domain-containing protein n=1 Tax=Archangium gephyra TaxID=48 RepID=A0AAC8Q3K8_9BACT|nr:hypothetical protein [Archangium gephyra]AKJ00453.1 Hypothetical protein AA314_02079 [Archangium gephyra]REG32849.1 hypothetical protein ATI61_104139 [Archangium gephyra]